MAFRKFDADLAKIAREMASVGSFGFLMAGSILLGYFTGNFLDNYFDASPWFLVIFILLGAAGGILEYKKILKKTFKDQEKDEIDRRNRPAGS